MISSIRLNHVNVKQIIMINVIWLCNAWRILVKLILNYRQSTMLYQITIKHKYNCQYTLIKHKKENITIYNSTLDLKKNGCTQRTKN